MNKLYEIAEIIKFLNDLDSLEINGAGELIIDNCEDYHDEITNLIYKLNTSILEYKKEKKEILINKIKELTKDL